MYFLFHRIDRADTRLPVAMDIIHPFIFSSHRLNSMHTVVLTIPHLNPFWVC
jgi:hypothetical protein